MVFTGIMLAVAPAAQAAVALAPAVCAPMMKMSAPMDCCKTSCDCTVKSQSPELSVDLPTAAPRFESLSNPIPSEFSVLNAFSSAADELPAEESPPSKDPLYQIYSDYRL